MREASSALGEDPFFEAKHACGFDPLEVVRDAAVAVRLPRGGGKETTVLALELDRGPEAALECMQKLGAKPVESGGVEPRPGVLALAAGSLLIVGDAAGARMAAARAKSTERSELARPMREAIGRFPDAAIVGVARVGEVMQETGFDWATLAVTASDQRFALRVEADTMDATTAQSYAAAFDPAHWGTPANADLPKTRIWVEGSRVLFELSVDGPPTEQAYRVGIGSSLAITAVRRYLARSKGAEARNSVSVISKDLVAYVEAQPAGKRRFPPSAPLTPKDVPKGKRTALGPEAWKHPTWKAIQFELTEPVYYSYEIVTARDGKSAVVRATGDLDGDGVLSRYSLSVTLDKKGSVAVSPDMSVENELE